MLAVTKLMIQTYNITDTDFMGYKVKKHNIDFHHLIIPRRNCKREGLGSGYLLWNGAPLDHSTSHRYLHIIERYNNELFNEITSEMIDMTIKKSLDVSNLKEIQYLLRQFDRWGKDLCDRHGNPLVREQFVKTRQNL